MDRKKFENKMWWCIIDPLMKQRHRQSAGEVLTPYGFGLGHALELGPGLGIGEWVGREIGFEWDLEQALKGKYGQKKV